MRVFEAEFHGVVFGGHAVIVARSKKQASALLQAKLEADGLAKEQTADSVKIREVDATTANCRILFNGDY